MYIIQVYKGVWVTVNTGSTFETHAAADEYRNRVLPIGFGPTRVIRETEVQS